MSWGKGSINITRPHRLLGLKHTGDPADYIQNHLEKNKRAPPPPPVPGTPIPDPTDVAVRVKQQQALKRLFSRRGTSSTLLSGRAGDTSPTATRAAQLVRGFGS